MRNVFQFLFQFEQNGGKTTTIYPSSQENAASSEVHRRKQYAHIFYIFFRSWMRFPQVSLKMAIVAPFTCVGGVVNMMPSDVRCLYSFSMSSTPNDAAGMPCLKISF